MAQITYFRRTQPLTQPDTVAPELPADEATAAVLLAALLIRRHTNQWTGEYGAVIDPEDGSRPVLITEEDPHVMIARGLLLTIADHGSYRDDELTRVRAAILRLLRRVARE